MAQVHVKPIDTTRWHGKSSREFASSPVKIEAFLDPATNKYATGLTEAEKNELELLTGYDLSDNYIAGRPHPFYSKKVGTVVLRDETNIFDSTNTLDRIKIALMRDSHLIANSQAALDNGEYPYAKFVIYDEQEEIAEKASKSSLIKKVYQGSSKLTPAKKADIVLIALGESVKKQSNDYIEVRFDDALETIGAERMLGLMESDPKFTSMQAVVLEGLQKNILRKEGSSIYYMDAFIAFDVSSAVEYFLDKNNQSMKATILEKIN